MKLRGIFAVVLLHQLASTCAYSGRSISTKYCTATSKYRPVDGKFNDFCKNTGKSFEAYTRLKEANYEDNVWQMRTDLPIVRRVVNDVFRQFDRDVSKVRRTPNFLSAMMGQYIAHDIGSRTDAKKANQTIVCCRNTNEEPISGNDRPAACCPIVIPEDDPDFGRKFPKMHCISMLRSKTVGKNNKYPADQLNEVTVFLDNSNLYGSEKTTYNSMRTGSGGQMKTNAQNIMPEKDGKFYLGDARLGQTPQLALLHSLYLREHNRVAKILQALNPKWKDNRLFEETRRIVIAQFQHLVYEEFLPAFIDPSIMEGIDSASYSSKLDMVAFNECAASIFRIFHSFIPTNIHLISKNGTFTTHKLNRILLNTDLLRTNYDDIALGMLMQPIRTAGYDPELYRGLFARTDKDPGTDLASIDLTRGRDHGLPPYVTFLREFKAGAPITKFKHFSPYISDENIELLRRTYGCAEDVDLLVGAMLETPIDGSLLGPTAQSILFSQFKRLKAADPYFYTNPKSPYPFTGEQLKEIRKFSSNHLICRNSGVDNIPQRPSMAPTSSSHIVSCDTLPKISYKCWA